MRAMLICLLVMGGCGSDDAVTPEQPVSTPTPDAKMPDVSTVKQTLTPAQLAVGDPIQNSIGMVLVPIPAGEFFHPFHLGAMEVTQGQWQSVMGTTPWKGKDLVKEGDDYPVTFVSWDDAVKFCEKLSDMPEEKALGNEYRLPQGAEWEYACRAETNTTYSFGEDVSQLDDYAWYDNSAPRIGEEYAHIAGQKRPNPWGLYDVYGNVSEWCQDWKDKNPQSVFPNAGRMYRGGSFYSNDRGCRSTFRLWCSPSSRTNTLGFRVLRSFAESSKQPISDPKPTAKTPDVSPSVEQPLTDVATVKKTLTPAQLAIGDPIVNSVGMVLVPIPAGEFLMGTPKSEVDFEDEYEPQFRVTLTKSFHLSQSEVTQEQFGSVTGMTPWKDGIRIKEGNDYPATYVSWHDTVEFCRKLSEKEGVEYRLPTEAEWEYACRAGTTTRYSFGDDAAQLGDYAWMDKNTDDIGEVHAHIVGQKQPNPWGLYDMHGNVWEWCQDWHGDYPDGDVTDSVGPSSGSRRVWRGGSWLNGENPCRSAYRASDLPSFRFYGLGFRVVRSSVK